MLAGSQTYWTQEVEQALTAAYHGVKEYYMKLLQQLDDLTKLVRGNLSKLARLTLGALITIDVHARDVTNQLVVNNVSSVGDFEWISQMRYYWEGAQCVVKQVQTAFKCVFGCLSCLYVCMSDVPSLFFLAVATAMSISAIRRVL